MEPLNDFDSSDPVSEILRVIRIRSTVHCRSLMGAPWGFGVKAHGNPAFHVVVSGSCWLELGGERDQLPLATGDLIVLPTGRRHWLRDQPSSPATELDEILARTPLDADRRLHCGGPGPQTALLCGGFALEGGQVELILRALPSLLHIRGAGGRPVPWLSATLTLLSAETASRAPGAEEVVARLADTLLIQALRVGLAELDSVAEAGVLGLRDPQIAAAIKLIHSQPERAWTVSDVAAEVALSRSAFSARFRELVGESPRRYVNRTRLAHAATLLRTTDDPIAQIAGHTGYGTEFSFGKAFKLAFGVAPGTYRGQPGHVPGLTPSPDAAGVGS
jgi:AraC family transcriptional regulator, alkane utilization regulator